MNDEDNIRCRVYPALTTPGKFIVATAGTGTCLDIEGNFGLAQLRYFDSPAEAVQYTISLNKPENPRQYIF